jgi:hypothetical protein
MVISRLLACMSLLPQEDGEQWFFSQDWIKKICFGSSDFQYVLSF